MLPFADNSFGKPGSGVVRKGEWRGFGRESDSEAGACGEGEAGRGEEGGGIGGEIEGIEDESHQKDGEAIGYRAIGSGANNKSGL